MTLLATLMVKLLGCNFYQFMPRMGFRPWSVEFHLLEDLFKDDLPIELQRLVGLALLMNISND